MPCSLFVMTKKCDMRLYRILRYLVTIFGFTKLYLYVTLSSGKFCLQCVHNSLGVAIFLYGMTILGRMALINTGPHVVNDNRFLTDLQEPYQLIYFIILFFIGINVSLLMVFFKLRNLRHDSIPGLGSQMTSNLIVVPFIFFSTVTMAVFTLVWHKFTTCTE